MLYAHVAAAVEQIQSGEEELCLERTLAKGVVTIGASEIALQVLPASGAEGFPAEVPGRCAYACSITPRRRRYPR